ncbi:hypothetical protein NLU13_6581 [Sarocladium strictum]|uniref:Rhodopsin domain-containing protein n=1 Tax=Sarocladium strictum TaxID=5046 RepID=A0AA39GG62_SARSR|nr:hypothetical protein NLU13_6581 [Sarocladium strictum]
MEPSDHQDRQRIDSIQICCCGFTVVTALQTRWGLGLQHLVDLPPQNIPTFGLLQFAGAPFYITSIYCFKLSLLFSYLRIINTKVYRWATIAVIVLCTLFHLLFLLIQINLCTPVALQWDTTLKGTCIHGVPFYLSMASLTICFDVVVMLLPFPALLKAQIQSRKKVVLLCLFGLGIFISVIQIFRIRTVTRLSNYLDSAPLIMWSTVENNLGVIVACIPTLSPLVKYFSEKVSSRGTGTPGNTIGSKFFSAKGGSKPGGHAQGGSYALQSWRGRNSGLMPLGSGVDHEFGRGTSDSGSTEMIFDNVIVKKTDLTIESNAVDKA